MFTYFQKTHSKNDNFHNSGAGSISKKRCLRNSYSSDGEGIKRMKEVYNIQKLSMHPNDKANYTSVL